MYICAVQKDIIKEYERHRPIRSNLSKEEEQALRTLRDDQTIVIKPADKGGAVVVLDRSVYIAEGFRQLGNSKFYRELPSNPTDKFESEIKDALTTLRKAGQITDKTFKALIPRNSGPGRFYLLPKIHKINNPGRPIVSSNGTVTEKISSFIDSLIKDIPSSFPSYIKDTNHFLREVSNLTVPAGGYLVTMDVASLYTNIPHAEGIASAVSAYAGSSQPRQLDKDTVETLLNLVLKYNHFEFEDKHYLQISGTAMGTKMAPNYANIFMASLEIPFLANSAVKPIFYKRFLDDIFFVWADNEQSLLDFISNFNSLHPSICFTHNFSQDSIHFLDVTLSLSGGRISTSLYKKPTDRQQYLHFYSSHPITANRHSLLPGPQIQKSLFRICAI